MTHRKMLNYIAVFLIIIAGIYFFWQENPLVKVWEPEKVVTDDNM